jgi:hypothetical protein
MVAAGAASVKKPTMLEKRLWILSELLEGESLRPCLQRGAVPWRPGVSIAIAVAGGLAATVLAASGALRMGQGEGRKELQVGAGAQPQRGVCLLG